MQPGPNCIHHLEWPSPGARVCGPVLWLRGWVVGRPGHDFCDVRARYQGRVYLGLLGLPRTDLAAHFSSPRAWLPAEFVLGLPVADGGAEISLEAQDAFGAWHGLQHLAVTVAPDGEANPREVGRVETHPAGNWTTRGAHLPFHGHLDDPKVETPLRDGCVTLFGWLLHETQAIRNVWATTDLRVFHHVEHGVTDDALAAKVPALAQARHSRLRGATVLSPALTLPACIRVYAELADGSVHLCLAQRVVTTETPAPPRASPPPAPAIRPAILAARPSGRPHRLLMSTLNLEGEDSTLRALDIARHLTARAEWAVRLVTMADGPLRGAFEAAGVSVQIVDPQPLFSAGSPRASEDALTQLGRLIWFKHLDAIAVFDADCGWLAELGRRNRIPVLVDRANAEQIIAPPFFPITTPAASAVIWAWDPAAQADSLAFAEVPATRVPAWHSANLPALRPPDAGRPHLMLAPIRGTARQGSATLLHAGDWLARYHPDFAVNHRLVVGSLRVSGEEQRFGRDAAMNQPAMMAIEAIGLDRAAACICPAFAGHPVRMLLDSAAIGLPIVTTPSPAHGELFTSTEVAYVEPGNPLSLAHAMVDLAANPAAARRRAVAAQSRVLNEHAPAPLLRRWQAVLESMVAAAR